MMLSQFTRHAPQRTQHAPHAQHAPPTHALYVKVGDAKSRPLTLTVLRYMAAKKQVMSQMGIRVQVFKISEDYLDSDRLVSAMKRRGITNLPAIVIPSGNVYLGVERILSLYDKNIQDFLRQQKSAASSDGDDIVEEYLHREMGADAWRDAKKGGEERVNDDPDDMMSRYRAALSRRKPMPDDDLSPMADPHYDEREDNLAEPTDNIGDSMARINEGTHDDEMMQSFWENMQES